MLAQTRPTEDPYAHGGSLVSTYSAEIDAFIQIGVPAFKTAVQNDTVHAWLNDVIDANGTTIRLYVLSRL